MCDCGADAVWRPASIASLSCAPRRWRPPLAASVIHSLVDFVWYISSLMAITILLAGAAYRLALLSQRPAASVRRSAALPGPPWQWRLAPLAVACWSADGWF